ncbi:hypothetical protein Fmac_015806 [Flemingia macrophylla]|uniref:Uncharacterized protein n=1 Tax=Flemingia macrophylla TaxID=520843 RepID=A0ABD1MGG6_9FABA
MTVEILRTLKASYVLSKVDFMCCMIKLDIEFEFCDRPNSKAHNKLDRSSYPLKVFSEHLVGISYSLKLIW